MKKIIFLLLIAFFLVGCNAEYTLTINEDNSSDEKVLIPICTEAKFIAPEEDSGFFAEIPKVEEVDIDEINKKIKKIYKS